VRVGSDAQADPTTEDLLSTLPGAPRARTSSSARPAPPAPGAEVGRNRPAQRVAAQVPRKPAAISSGTEAPVRESAEPRSGATRAGAGPYAIQTGAFGNADAAGRRAAEVRDVARDLPVEIRRQDGWLKVFVGSFATREQAESALRELTARGLGAAWVTRVAQ
jgi:cell division protein FtsN